MTVVTWTPTDVSANLGDETTSLRGWISSVEPNLAINVSGSGKIWGVTHVPSGWGVARWFQTRGAAEALVLAISPFADWSLAAPALRQSDDLAERVWPVRAEIYAREEHGDFGPVDLDLIALWNRYETRSEESQKTRELGLKVRARREHHRS